MRAPPVSRRKRSCRLWRICANDSARTRAAASSIAKGMPSRRSQISATGAESCSFTTKSGRTWRARSVNNVTASSVSDREGTPQATSPGTRRGSRLVARTFAAGQAPSSATVSAEHASIRCSQLSRTRRTCRPAMARMRVSIVERPAWSGSASARVTATGTTVGSVIGARSTYHTPSANSVSIRSAICTARSVGQ